MSSETAAIPSPGCALGKLTPTAPFHVSYGLPPSYDGLTPGPLIVELQATNTSNHVASHRAADGQDLSQRYAVVAPRPLSDNSSFESMTEAAFFTQLDEALAEVCFDTNRVFAAGNGSGGRVLITSFLKYAARAAAPGVTELRLRAAAVLGIYTGRSKLATPLIFIHGAMVNDASFGDTDGTKGLAQLRTTNVCGESTTPVSAEACATEGATVDPNCVDFEDCVAPLRWCQPDDPALLAGGYDPWPCFANAAIDQFFAPYLE